MNDVESRLQAAAAETRRFAGTRWPTDIGGKASRRPPGWLVFAAGFAVVLVTLGLLPLVITGDAPPVAGPGPDETPVSTVPPPSTATADVPASSTATTDVPDLCSSTGVPPPTDQPALSDSASATRDAIADAAASCAFASLERLAGDQFTTSFGGGGAENLARWEEEGQGRLGTLLHLLGLSHGTIPDDTRGLIYVWPAAATYDSWDDVPAAERAELRAVHTDEELAMMRDFGSYSGWRTGIDEQGNWLYFVAGD